MQWDKVIFSEESSFTIRPTTNKERVWCKANTKFNLHNLVPAFKSDYATVFVWGAFSTHGRTPLIRINGTLKQKEYK